MRQTKIIEDGGEIKISTALKFIDLYEEAFKSRLVLDAIGNHEGMWNLYFTNDLDVLNENEDIHHFMKVFKSFCYFDTIFNYQINYTPQKHIA